ncbi:MAG: 50S ribosomal protein L23 [Rickettsiaceae bacterium H1]|nr:50S ribosomal protein L23 [Rickettsiaceae bacterium H1]
MNIAKLIDRVLITEKSSVLSEENNSITIVFSSCKVTKAIVKDMMKLVFPNAKIKSIRSITMHPKAKVFRGIKGVCVKRKKMILSFENSNGFNVMNEVEVN